MHILEIVMVISTDVEEYEYVYTNTQLGSAYCTLYIYFSADAGPLSIP